MILLGQLLDRNLGFHWAGQGKLEAKYHPLDPCALGQKPGGVEEVGVVAGGTADCSFGS